MTEDILRNVHKLSFYVHNLKLLTVRNFFYKKKRHLMLVYQVEVITFPKIFLQKIMLSIYFYLFTLVFNFFCVSVK